MRFSYGSNIPKGNILHSYIITTLLRMRAKFRSTTNCKTSSATSSRKMRFAIFASSFKLRACRGAEMKINNSIMAYLRNRNRVYHKQVFKVDANLIL
jgi:hypothetical protein